MAFSFGTKYKEGTTGTGSFRFNCHFAGGTVGLFGKPPSSLFSESFIGIGTIPDGGIIRPQTLKRMSVKSGVCVPQASCTIMREINVFGATPRGNVIEKFNPGFNTSKRKTIETGFGGLRFRSFPSTHIFGTRKRSASGSQATRRTTSTGLSGLLPIEEIPIKKQRVMDYQQTTSLNIGKEEPGSTPSSAQSSNLFTTHKSSFESAPTISTACKEFKSVIFGGSAKRTGFEATDSTDKQLAASSVFGELSSTSTSAQSSAFDMTNKAIFGSISRNDSVSRGPELSFGKLTESNNSRKPIIFGGSVPCPSFESVAKTTDSTGKQVIPSSVFGELSSTSTSAQSSAFDTTNKGIVAVGSISRNYSVSRGPELSFGTLTESNNSRKAFIFGSCVKETGFDPGTKATTTAVKLLGQASKEPGSTPTSTHSSNLCTTDKRLFGSAPTILAACTECKVSLEHQKSLSPPIIFGESVPRTSFETVAKTADSTGKQVAPVSVFGVDLSTSTSAQSAFGTTDKCIFGSAPRNFSGSRGPELSFGTLTETNNPTKPLTFKHEPIKKSDACVQQQTVSGGFSKPIFGTTVTPVTSCSATTVVFGGCGTGTSDGSGSKKEKLAAKFANVDDICSEVYTDAHGSRNVRTRRCSNASSVDTVNTIEQQYPITAIPVGVAVIISNHDFSKAGHGFNDRDGTHADQANLVFAFKKAGFSVELHEDLTSTDIRDCMNHYSRADHSSRSCFMCCIMSHGTSGKIYGVDGELVPLIDLTAKFSPKTCPSLVDKPKLFMIVSCQGKKERVCPPGPSTATDTDPVRDGTTHQDLIPLNDEDYLVAYSTLPGHVSYRNRDGTPFIKHFITNFLKYRQSYDILQILKNTNKYMKSHPHTLEDGRKIQLGCILFSTLTQPLILQCPSIIPVTIERFVSRADDTEANTSVKVEPVGPEIASIMPFGNVHIYQEAFSETVMSENENAVSNPQEIQSETNMKFGLSIVNKADEAESSYLENGILPMESDGNKNNKNTAVKIEVIYKSD